jgi:hypothetical protein
VSSPPLSLGIELGCTYSRSARRVLHGYPRRPDHRQHDRTLGYVVIDGLAKILARADIGDVHEDGAGAEVADQIGIEAPRLALCVRPPIAQENYAAHQITAMLLYLKDKIVEKFAQSVAWVTGTKAEVSDH